MALLDAQRRHVDINGPYLRLLGYPRDQLIGVPASRFVVGGPLLSDPEWRAMLRAEPFTGEVDLITGDGSVVEVQWSVTPEVVTGRDLVLFVALSTSRWGRHLRRDTQHEAGDNRALSPREREIVRLVAMGNTGPEIADELHLSHDTVRTHVRNAMAKLGARSRAHLVARALGQGAVFA